MMISKTELGNRHTSDRWHSRLASQEVGVAGLNLGCRNVPSLAPSPDPTEFTFTCHAPEGKRPVNSGIPYLIVG